MRWAETWYKQGAKLSRMVLDKSVDFWALTQDERQMVEDYDTRHSARIWDGMLNEKWKRSLTVARQSCCNDRAEQPAP